MTSSSYPMTSPGLLLLRLIVTCLLATVSHGRSVVIETGPVYDYVYVDDYGVYTTQGRQMSFNIRASNDAQIALARLKHNTTVDSYEVVIGGWYNQRSTIRRCDQCVTAWWVDHHPLNETYSMPFWVTWALNVSGGLTIRTGSGYVVLQNEFMSWYDPDPHDINYVGVSTGWTSNGTWIFEVVDGGWSSWGSWTPCAASCGAGIRARERRCNNPTPVYGRPCNDTPRQYEPCNNTEVSCIGDWTGWSSWSQCSVTCGSGQQTRARRCLTPDRPCPGSSTDQISCLMDPCQVDGAWSEWQPWTTCSSSCGLGTRSRQRTCSNPAPQFNGRTCSGNASMAESCQMAICPVDGQWSSWSDWSACNASCGQAGGWSYRNRSCSNPPPQYDGDNCHGNSIDTSPCNVFNCSVNGSWSEWQAWTNCSANCGNGTKTRIRQCSDPFPLSGGAPCVGSDTEEVHCFLKPCPLDGNWSEWQPWTSCSASCGNGTRRRIRQCNDPLPQSDGASCVGSGSEDSQCIVGICPVDGQWSAWSVWSTCSVPCGGGVSSRTRDCNAPPPQFGGAECNGSGVENNTCNNQSCSVAVDGVWSTWSSWSDCSRTCAIGQRVRRRTCSHPPPSGGGLTCPGSDTEEVNCKMDDCQTNSATWSVWSDWTICPVSCGSGVQSRFRICEEPGINWDLIPCVGDDNETSVCNNDSCPVDGGWSAWSSWSPSCPSCGPGVTYRQRSCSNPVPLYGGTNCSGSSQEQMNCPTIPCPVDGGWSVWSAWSPSCPSCGYGVTYRQRSCSNPVPLYGGTNCSGSSQEQMNCSTIPCPVDGGWSEWSAWSPSCPSCGPGVTYRQRNCSNPVPLYGGTNCSGALQEQMNCTTNPCPVDGGWSAWTSWSPSCPSCGPGVTYRQRNCSNPDPLYGGTNCSGASQEQMNCSTIPCPVDGGWSEWSAWSPSCPSCGPGVTYRQRNCSNPVPLYGGTNCSGALQEQMNCTTNPCPVDGGWSAWTSWSPSCPSCGPGVTYRQRNCSNPDPLYGGTNCSGASQEQMNCSTIPCPVDGGWSAWTSWSPSCPSCGPGVTYRQRNCSNPDPLYGGTNCSGASQEQMNCTTIPCPVDGGWSEWSVWSACPACGPGLSKRFRNCTNPEPMYGGSNCSGESNQSSNCTGRPCPVNGAWTPWSAWSNCSVTCESGLANRYRNCSNPRPQNGGNNCAGNNTDVKKCTLRSCPMDGAWSMWTNWADCNVTCGSGWTTRKRSCNNPSPFFGGRTCPGAARESKTCVIDCPVSRGGGNNAPPAQEAPGAQAIGVIGIAICVALIAAIMLLDLVSINKHFAFMRKNVNYGWQRVVAKFRPLAAGKPQRRKTLRRSTVRRAYSAEGHHAGRRDTTKEALAEQQTVTLKRTVSGGPEGVAAKGAGAEGVGVAGTVPALAPRPVKRPLAAMASGNLNSGTTKSSAGRFEKSLDAYDERGVAAMTTKEDLDTKL